MNDKVNGRNILALHEAIKLNRVEIAELKDQVQAQAGSLAILQADIASTKQLIAVLKGVGMGSTVHK